MKRKPPSICSAIFVSGLFSLFLSTTFAAENIVALGAVRQDGVLASSANTVEGAIVSSNPSTGRYDILLNATGAFTGSSVSDYIVEVTVNQTISNDEIAKAAIIFVAPNQLNLRVLIDDVEDSTDPEAAEPRDIPFHFVIYRVPSSFPTAGDTRYLLSSARIQSSGQFRRSFVGLDGIAISHERIGNGEYIVTLSKRGYFASDSANDYILSLSQLIAGIGDGFSDNALRGGVSDVSSDDSVEFTVHSDEVQAGIPADIPVPKPSEFHLTVYRIPNDMSSPSHSRLLLALARVSGLTGEMLSTPRSMDGGTISSARVGVGRYEVTIVSDGAFAGKAREDFTVQVFLNQSVNTDNQVAARDAEVVDSSTLKLRINTDDLESSSATIRQRDASFFLVLSDSSARLQQDHRIGKSRNINRMSGNDRSGIAGRLNLRARGNRTARFYWAVENDGNLIDGYRLKARENRRFLRTKYFSLTGGSRNVTGAVKRGRYIENDLPIKDIRVFKGIMQFRGGRDVTRANVRIITSSTGRPYPLVNNDNSLITLKPR